MNGFKLYWILLKLVSAVTRWVSISAVGLKIYAIMAVIKKYKWIMSKKEKEA